MDFKFPIKKASFEPPKFEYGPPQPYELPRNQKTGKYQLPRIFTMRYSFTRNDDDVPSAKALQGNSPCSDSDPRPGD